MTEVTAVSNEGPQSTEQRLGQLGQLSPGARGRAGSPYSPQVHCLRHGVSQKVYENMPRIS